MSRALVIVSVGLSIGLTTVATAASPNGRTVTAEYVGPGEIATGGPAAGQRLTPGHADFEVLPGERYLTVEITDALGAPVAGAIYQDDSSDGTPELEVSFCGETKKPVRILPSVPLTVWVNGFPCADRIPTRGVITATFRRTRS